MGLVALALTLAAVTGCGDDDDAAGPDDETTTTEAPDTTLSPEADVEAAYLAYREMVTRLLQAPNPTDPEIAERAVGENRDFLVDQLANLEGLGQALKFGPEHRYSVVDVSLRGTDAVVRDCTVDDAQTIQEASGEVVSQGTTTALLEATLSFNGAWRVREIASIEQWDGVTSCDA